MALDRGENIDKLETFDNYYLRLRNSLEKENYKEFCIIVSGKEDDRGDVLESDVLVACYIKQKNLRDYFLKMVELVDKNGFKSKVDDLM